MKLLPAFIVHRVANIITLPFSILVLSGLCVGLFTACATRPVTDHPKVLFPLEVGRYWQYRVTGDDQTVVENHIASVMTIGDTQWFESIEYGERFWIRNGSQGQIEAVNLFTKGENAAVFEQIDAKVIHEELMFKFPATQGESWSTLDNTITYEGSRKMVVPAGEFTCHQYGITQYGQTYSHSCIAEGVGVVYSDNILPDGKLEKSELLAWGKK